MNQAGVVRDLARRVAEAAARPEAEATRKRFRDVNALRRPDRAPVYCRPIGAWDEILPESRLICADPYLRPFERQFRQLLHKVELGDDTPIPTSFKVPAAFDVTPVNTWGVDIRRVQPEDPAGAWAYDPPLKTEADFDRLALPHWTLNREATDRAVGRANDLLGDILPVRTVCSPDYDNATICYPAANLRGLERTMVDMAEQPRLMHRLMAHLRDAQLRWCDAMESTGPLLTPNTDEAMLCSDAIGEPGANGRYSLANCWCAGNSQEFDAVSPAMWREFCLEYQKPIFARFGRSCYGCCENLARKIDGVLTIPNLRIFVCSAWTTLDAALEQVPARYCIMWRQKASDVVLPDDTDAIRHDLLDGARKLQGRPYQIVLRELQTLAGHPDRLHVWTRLAIEAAERYS